MEVWPPGEGEKRGPERDLRVEAKDFRRVPGRFLIM